MTDARTDTAAADHPFWTEEKLRNADTDRQGHVNNAVIATFFEAGRIEVLAHPDIASFRDDHAIVVARLLILYKKELFFPGTVRVGSRIARIGRSSFDFDQVLLAANGEVASAQATCVLIDRATRKPAPLPDAMRRLFTSP